MKIKIILYLIAYLVVMGCDRGSTGADGESPPLDITDTLVVQDSIVLGLMYEFEVEDPYAKERQLIDLAINEINAAGGVNGYPLTYTIRNTYVAEDAPAAAEDLYNYGVKFIIGAGWSSRTINIADSFAVDHNMLMVSYSATSPLIADLDDNNLVWRGCPSDNFQLTVLADWLLDAKGITTAAAIYRGDAFGIGAAGAFVTAFEAGGGSVVSSVAYPTEEGGEEITFNTFDFSPYLDSVLTQQPEVVVYISYIEEEIKLLSDLTKNELFEANPSMLVGIEGLDVEELKNNIADTTIFEHIWSIGFLIDSTTSSYQDFSTAYTALYSEGISISNYTGNYNVILYDNVYLLALAIEKAAVNDTIPITARMVAEQMKAISGGVANAVKIYPGEWAKADSVLAAGGSVDYDGVSGAIEFDDNGDIGSATFGIYYMKNPAGALEPDTVISFSTR
ncbi:MAG: hypothetical protein CL661_02820 [Bacteroidetes bacterium]|nr:hypothetical protein [Bacteroidota bacterium]